MGDLADLRTEIERLLRGSGVAWDQVGSVLDNVKSRYPQFAADLSVGDEEIFLSTFKKVLYFALFAHAPSMPTQAATKYDAWLWVKEYAGKFLNATDEANFDKRTVIGGMATAFDRALIVMGRIKFPLYWPTTLRSEFISLWSTLSDRRMSVNGWNLEPAQGGSPSMRYWRKAKAVSEAMKANQNASEECVAAGSPGDGPSDSPSAHEVFGHWSSSDEDCPSLPPVGAGMPARSPVRMGVNLGPEAASSFSPQFSEGDSANDLIRDTLKREEQVATQNPLEGWPDSENRWAITTGRLYHAEGAFAVDLKTLKRHQVHSDTDIITLALQQVGAKRVPSTEFWTLDKDGQPWDVLKGRDFVVWQIPERAVCECRHEYRMGVRLGPSASGNYPSIR